MTNPALLHALAPLFLFSIFYFPFSSPDPEAHVHLPSKGGWRWSPLLMLLVGLAGFTAVAADVICHGQLERWDRPLQAAIHNFAKPTQPGDWPLGVLIFSAISGLGEFFVVAGVGILVGALLALRKRFYTLFAWGLALIGSGIINPALKSAFRIPRPSVNTFYTFSPGSGWSFPSGHTMAVTITAGALALVVLHLNPHTRTTRTLTWSAAVAISLLVGFALMYVGVHYLTDVLGALAISLAWLGVIRFLLPPNLKNSNRCELPPMIRRCGVYWSGRGFFVVAEHRDVRGWDVLGRPWALLPLEVSKQDLGTAVIEAINGIRDGLSEDEGAVTTKNTLAAIGEKTWNTLERKWEFIHVYCDAAGNVDLSPMHRCSKGGYLSIKEDPIYHCSFDAANIGEKIREIANSQPLATVDEEPSHT